MISLGLIDRSLVVKSRFEKRSSTWRPDRASHAPGLLGDLVHRMRQVADVTGGDTSHGNPTVLREKDRKLFGETIHLQQCDGFVV